jgi:hypothetical protein
MRDLESLLGSLVNVDRTSLIAILCSEAERSERVVKTIRMRTGAQRQKRQEALRHVERIGRILYFLRHGTPADGATDEDMALCNRLAEKLRGEDMAR